MLPSPDQAIHAARRCRAIGYSVFASFEHHGFLKMFLENLSSS